MLLESHITFLINFKGNLGKSKNNGEFERKTTLI